MPRLAIASDVSLCSAILATCRFVEPLWYKPGRRFHAGGRSRFWDSIALQVGPPGSPRRFSVVHDPPRSVSLLRALLVAFAENINSITIIIFQLPTGPRITWGVFVPCARGAESENNIYGTQGPGPCDTRFCRTDTRLCRKFRFGRGLP